MGQSGLGNYKLLAQLAMSLCLIPHSNAVAERVFSLINKNLTAQRKSMKKDTTLNNIMIVKCADLPIDFEPEAELLKNAKRATRLSLIQADESE